MVQAMGGEQLQSMTWQMRRLNDTRARCFVDLIALDQFEQCRLYPSLYACQLLLFCNGIQRQQDGETSFQARKVGGEKGWNGRWRVFGRVCHDSYQVMRLISRKYSCWVERGVSLSARGIHSLVDDGAVGRPALFAIGAVWN